jgi:hypothetical protein
VTYAPFRFSYLHLRTVILFFRNKKRTFVYQKFSFCLSKPQAWHIITARRAVYIIQKADFGLLFWYLITRQRAFFLRLDDIPQQVADDMQNFVLMIYKASP